MARTVAGDNGPSLGNSGVFSQSADRVLKSTGRRNSLVIFVVLILIWMETSAESIIRQQSSCKAVINEFVYNLQPLMRTDGSPRFVVEDEHNQWNFSFNPCSSFNLPTDPHEGEGDQCHYVAMCQWRRTTSTGEYFSLGIQRHARFALLLHPGTKTFHGNHSNQQHTGATNRSLEHSNHRSGPTDSRGGTISPSGSQDFSQATVTTPTPVAIAANLAVSKAVKTGNQISSLSGLFAKTTLVSNGKSKPTDSDKDDKAFVLDGSILDDEYRGGHDGNVDVVDFSSTFATASVLSQDQNEAEPRSEALVSDELIKKMSKTTSEKNVDDDDENGNYETVDEDDHHYSSQHTRVPAILFRGLKSKSKKKVRIYLICDYNRTKVDDAVLLKIKNHTEDKSFELHHRCCCPNGCLENSLTEYSLEGVKSHSVTSSTIASKSRATSQAVADQLPQTGQVVSSDQDSGLDAKPKYIWLILVINGGILIIAVFVAGVCCKKGGMSFVSTGTYGYVPAIPAAMQTSRLTMDSIDLDNRYVSTQKLSSPDYRDYGSAAQIGRAPVLDNCVIPSSQLDVGQRLGGGLFSDTYLAEYKKRHVAVKRITVTVHQNQLTEADSGWMTNEVLRLSHQRHRNLVAVLGICVETRQPYVITELIEGDTLKDKILSMEIEQYNWHQRIKLCLQVTDGMAFLHSAKTPVLHRDLRCANILIDQYGKAKIVDYGLTKIVQRLRNECEHGAGCYCQKEHSAFPASVRWTAPEIVRNPTADEEDTTVFSTACDVYSFAMVCWEIASYRDPFEEYTDEQVIESVLQNNRPPVDSLLNTIIPFRELMKACWSQNPEARPTFKQIAVTLKAILQVGGRLLSQMKRKHTNSESGRDSTTRYLRSALNISEM